MATKENQTFSKLSVNYTEKSTEFSNLNLNQSHKCSNTSKLDQSFSKSKNYKNIGYTVTDNYQENGKSWNKSTKDLSLKTSKNPNLNNEAQKEEVQKRWMSDKTDDKNSSTLSLHISAYENSFEVSDSSENLSKKSKTFKSIDFASKMQMNQNAFEFPRTMDGDGKNAPQLMQFKASQKLFLPNQGAVLSSNEIQGPRWMSTETTVTEHSTFEESMTIEYRQMDEKTMKEKIQEFEAEMKEIEGETKEEERATRKLRAVINNIKVGNNETKQALDDALSWPNSLLQNSEKWLAIWESELGKKTNNNRSAKTAQNAILAAAVTKQVEYAREWIARFRERKAHYETTGNRLCEQMKDDYASFEYDIHELRRELCEWQKRAAFNQARTKEMLETKQSLDRIVDEKKMLVTEIKNDINEFERELLAISYTLDQIALQ